MNFKAVSSVWQVWLFFSSHIFPQENHPQSCSLLEVPDTNIKEWPPEGIHKWVIVQDLSLQPPPSCWQDQEHLCFLRFFWRSCKSFLVSMKESEFNVFQTLNEQLYKYSFKIREQKMEANSCMRIYDQKKHSGQHICVVLMPAGTKDVQMISLMWTKKSHCRTLPVSSTTGC